MVACIFNVKDKKEEPFDPGATVAYAMTSTIPYEDDGTLDLPDLPNTRSKLALRNIPLGSSCSRR